MLTKMRLVIIALLPKLNAQNKANEKQNNAEIAEYTLDLYWVKPDMHARLETIMDIKMLEVLNNHSQSDKLFVQVHCVCKSKQFIGNVYSVSYKDKDHLRELRFFLAHNLSV